MVTVRPPPAIGLSAATAATPGSGSIAIERVGRRSRVMRSLARSPLRLVTPTNHGHAAWVFTSTFGGGLVDGDRIALDIQVGDGASALVTSQAQTKVYRSPSGCHQQTTARVGRGGTLVIAPDPVVGFRASRFDQFCQVRLDSGATLVLVDGLIGGRIESGERWQFDRFCSRIHIDGPEGPVLRDAIELDPCQGPLGARMGRFTAMSTILAIGPGARLAEIPEAVPGGDLLCVASPIGGGRLIRIAAVSAHLLAMRVRQLLSPVADLLGDDPFARKW